MIRFTLLALAYGAALLAGALAMVLITGPARATVAPADLCLVLLQDTSSSLDAGEMDQVRAGLAGALIDPRLSSAFSASRVQVMVVAFAGSPKIVADWFPASPASLASAAAAIGDMPRNEVGGTAIGAAITFALRQFDRTACMRRVIDVATDGENNGGPSPTQVTADLDPMAVQVNGLVVGRPDQFASFRENVQFGFGAFSVLAASYDDFAGAMLRKLSIEISMNTGGRHAL